MLGLSGGRHDWSEFINLRSAERLLIVISTAPGHQRRSVSVPRPPQLTTIILYSTRFVPAGSRKCPIRSILWHLCAARWWIAFIYAHPPTNRPCISPSQRWLKYWLATDVLILLKQSMRESRKHSPVHLVASETYTMGSYTTPALETLRSSARGLALTRISVGELWRYA